MCRELCGPDRCRNRTPINVPGSGDGGAAHYRGPAGQRELRVRACAGLSDAVLFTTSPLLMNKPDRAVFGRVENSVKLSRYGGDCYAYCMLAAGQIDLIIETEIKPHDIVPLIPIIAGAGGIVSTWENGPAQGGGRVGVAGDSRVHRAALKMLKS
jgi:myo-inositol-1(or 4)-monophosphatase